jgi:hypothetical protein
MTSWSPQICHDSDDWFITFTSLSAARKAFGATDKQKLMEYTMEINLNSNVDLHSDRPTAEKPLSKSTDTSAPPSLAGSVNGWGNTIAGPEVNGKDDSWKKKHATGEELIQHAKEMLTQELVDVFMKDIKSRIVSPSIYDFLNPKLRSSKSQSDDTDLLVKSEQVNDDLDIARKGINGHSTSSKQHHQSRSEHDKSSRKYSAIGESRHSSGKGKDLLAGIDGLASLPDLSKLPRFKKRNQDSSTRERKQNGHKHSWRRSPSRSLSRRRYSDSDSDIDIHERGRRRKPAYSRDSSTDSSRSRRDSSHGRDFSRRRSWDTSPSQSRDRSRRTDHRQSDRYHQQSEEDDAYHSSASMDTSSRARTPSPSPYSKTLSRQRSSKLKKVKKEHRRLRDYLSDVDDQSDEHYDFLRKLNKQEKEESESEHDDAGFVVDDDEMVEGLIDELHSKTSKSSRKMAKSRSKRKGSVSSDDGEPDRKKSKTSLAKKSRQFAQDDSDERAMELDIEQNMAQLFDSESEYEEQKATRIKHGKAARKPKGANRNLTNGVRKKKLNSLKVEDDDVMEDVLLSGHRPSNAIDSPGVKSEAVVPSVVKTEHHVVNESSADESSDIDEYSESETIASDEFSDLDVDVEPTANGIEDWHPLKQVHDAEDIMFMKLAMQGYQTFDDNAPSESTHVIRTAGKSLGFIHRRHTTLQPCLIFFT